MTFSFDDPVPFETMTVSNVDDVDRYTRNYRVREYSVSVDGGVATIEGELADVQGTQTVDLNGVTGSVVTLTVLSTYPSTATAIGPAYDELAIADVGFIGR